MKIVFFVRKSDAYSIESISTTLFQSARAYKSDWSVEMHIMPYESNSILNIIKNIFFTFKRRGDINHVTGDVHYIILGLLFAKRNILTIHDCVYLSTKNKLSTSYWIFKIFWLNLPVKLFNIITAVSNKTKSEIIFHTKCDPNKIVVINNFVHPAFTTDHKISKNSGTIVILHVGTSWNKNLLNVIQSLEGENIKLFIVGELDVEIEKKLRDFQINFALFTNISHSELVDLFHQADLLSFPSIYEGFGLPIIEAFASRTAVLTSDMEPMREIADDAAHFVDPHSVASIRAGFVKLINDENYRISLVNKGSERVLLYSLPFIIDQYLKCYELPE